MRRTGRKTRNPRWPVAFGPLILLVLFPLLAAGQSNPPATEVDVGWEFTGLPALNFDSDEGFGYGAVLAIFDYGSGGLLPYRMSFQPTVFLTTEGRRDFSLFFDAPHLLPAGWRVDAYVGMEKQIATPYYGLGNGSVYDPALEEGENPYFYRFGRERAVFRANLQRSLGESPARVLLGGQWADFTIDPTPKDEGATLLAEELTTGTAVPGGRQNSIRVGLIWDTRDRESGPQRGVWSEALVERVDEAMGSESSFTRWTLADRRYFPLGSRFVFAHRVILQNVTGNPPFFALSYIQSSFGGEEGVGGAKSVRGVLRNRYVGEGLFVWNAELRWRVKQFRVIGKNAHLALTGFVDSGRVWEDGVELGSLLADLHHGVGGGMRVGLGPNFVIALDLATSQEAGLQSYIGLGYLF